MKRSALVSESLKLELAFSYNVIVALADGEASTWGQERNSRDVLTRMIV
jgi:hypothetical protein